MTIKTLAKTPAELRRLGPDWTRALSAGDSIVSAEWSAEGVTVVPVGIVGQRTIGRVSGGAVGATGRVTVTAITAGGEVLVRSVRIRIVAAHVIRTLPLHAGETRRLRLGWRRLLEEYDDAVASVAWSAQGVTLGASSTSGMTSSVVVSAAGARGTVSATLTTTGGDVIVRSVAIRIA